LTRSRFVPPLLLLSPPLFRRGFFPPFPSGEGSNVVRERFCPPFFFFLPLPREKKRKGCSPSLPPPFPPLPPPLSQSRRELGTLLVYPAGPVSSPPFSFLSFFFFRRNPIGKTAGFTLATAKPVSSLLLLFFFFFFCRGNQ